MLRPRRSAPRFLIGLALSLVACGGANDITGGKASFSGTFALQTIDNAALPVAILDLEDTKFVVLADTLRFASGGTVAETNVSTTTIDGSSTTSRQLGQGTFVVNTAGIMVSWAASGAYTYTVTQDGLSVFEPLFGDTWQYRRVGN